MPRHRRENWVKKRFQAGMNGMIKPLNCIDDVIFWSPGSKLQQSSALI
jgi:hypothetical protein